MGNTKTVGDTTEAVVLAEFTKAGIPVSVPFGENQRYDLVADVHGTLLRVQCKTGRVVQNASVLVFNATSHDGHRARQSYRNQADLFAVYSPYTQQVYVLDVNEVGETSVCSLAGAYAARAAGHWPGRTGCREVGGPEGGVSQPGRFNPAALPADSVEEHVRHGHTGQVDTEGGVGEVKVGPRAAVGCGHAFQVASEPRSWQAAR